MFQTRLIDITTQDRELPGRSPTIWGSSPGCLPRDANDPPASYAFLLAGVDPVGVHLFFYLLSQAYTSQDSATFVYHTQNK